jgi:hypothetical protein
VESWCLAGPGVVSHLEMHMMLENIRKMMIGEYTFEAESF